MRKIIRIAVILSLFVNFLLCSIPVSANPPANSSKFAIDHILVKFKAGTNAMSVKEVNTRHGGSVMKQITSLKIQVVKVPAGQIAEQIKAYQSDNDVEYAEPDYKVKAMDAPNDPYFYQQWGMTKIQAPNAWNMTTGNSNIKIAILDTGIDQDHEDLTAKITANQNFSTSATVDDLYGHGTHVAGIAAAITNNHTGLAGVGYNSSLMNVKVLDDTGEGQDSWVADGVIWAADNGAKVINLSLGGPDSSRILEDAINYAWNKGVVVVASAGNDGNNSPTYPAYYTNCISVAATDQNDNKATFSTYGTWVDVAAPGLSICSTLPNHTNYFQQNYGSPLNYGFLSGTSMSAPFVSGLAALVWSTAYGTGATTVRARIENTADTISGTGTYWQKGRINAFKAVSSAVSNSALASSHNPSAYSQAVTFTANITAAAPATGVPSGTVTFKDGTLILGTGILDNSGQATYSTPSLAVGNHSINVVYGGDANFNTSTSPVLYQNICKRGDANGNGEVDMGDVTKVEREIFGLDLPTPGADANLNGTIDMGDVVEIERIVLGLSNRPTG